MIDDYPVMLTPSDIKNMGITVESKGNSEVERFLDAVHSTVYDFILFANNRGLREKIIERYKPQLERQLRRVLKEVANAFWAAGDDMGIFTGVSRLDGNGVEIKDLQERLTAIVPPRAFNMLLALEPNVMFCGGEI